MQILSEKNPLEVYLNAANIAYKSVAHTLGPGGTNTAVVNKRNAHDIINDGYSILSKLTSLDIEESEALETIKLASFETNRKAGDGTTSTTILVYELLKGSPSYLNKKYKIFEFDESDIDYTADLNQFCTLLNI